MPYHVTEIRSNNVPRWKHKSVERFIQLIALNKIEETMTTKTRLFFFFFWVSKAPKPPEISMG